MIDIKSKKLSCNYEFIRVCENINVEDFCKKHCIKNGQIISNNALLKKGDFVLVSFPDSDIHIVMPGEKIEDIAQKHNVSAKYILTKNNCSKIFIGQIIYI